MMKITQIDLKFKILSILYNITFIFSIWVFFTRENTYMRPESFFFLLITLVSIIILQVFLSNLNKLERIIIFFEILMIPIIFTFSQQILYQTVLSRDPWIHWTLTEAILNNGYIPPYNEILIPYVKLPFFHLLIGSGILITDIPYKWSQFLFGGLPTLILLSILVWLISIKLFHNIKIAVLSTLFVGIADNVLDMIGKNIIPNSIGIAITFLIFYIIFFFKPVLYIKLISLILSITLLLTHTICYVFLIYQVCILGIIGLFFFNLKKIKFYFEFLVILIIFGIAEWLYYSEIYFNSLIITFQQLFIYGIDIARYEAKLPISLGTVMLSRLGMLIFFFFIGVGTIIALIRHRENYFIISFGIATLGIIIASGTIFSPALSGISHRFWFYGEVMGSIFFSFFIVNIVLNPNIKLKIQSIACIITILLIVPFGFLMMKASVANDDNPLIPEYTLRTGWLDSELSAGNFVIQNVDNIPIASDYDFLSNIRELRTNKLKLDQRSDILKNEPETFDKIIECRGLFITRIEYLKNRYFMLGGRWSQNSHIPLQEKMYNVVNVLKSEGYSIYDSNTILITLHNPH